jgi:hypothetical protein
MIAITKEPSQAFTAEQNDRFLEMLPLIRSQARRAFRRLHPELKEELFAETVANAYCRFSRLVRTGKAELAFATPLANYAIRQVLAGRRVGTKFNIRDLTSPHARSSEQVVIKRLDRFDREQGEWREVLVEDRRATPADIACARIDLTDWFRSLPRRHRRIAKALAIGESTSEAARRFGLSLARISQFRRELQANWEEFQGGGDPCAGPVTATRT